MMEQCFEGDQMYSCDCYKLKELFLIIIKAAFPQSTSVLRWCVLLLPVIPSLHRYLSLPKVLLSQVTRLSQLRPEVTHKVQEVSRRRLVCLPLFFQHFQRTSHSMAKNQFGWAETKGFLGHFPCCKKEQGASIIPIFLKCFTVGPQHCLQSLVEPLQSTLRLWVISRRSTMLDRQLFEHLRENTGHEV